MCTSDCACADAGQAAYAGVTRASGALVFGGSYTSYSACWTDVVNAGSASGLSPEDLEGMKVFFGFMNELESKYKCAGLCSAPLFSLTGDITAGPPTKGCWEPIVTKAFAGGTTVAAFGALFMFLTFFISLSLCGDKPLTPEEDDTQVEKMPQ